MAKGLIGENSLVKRLCRLNSKASRLDKGTARIVEMMPELVNYSRRTAVLNMIIGYVLTFQKRSQNANIAEAVITDVFSICAPTDVLLSTKWSTPNSRLGLASPGILLEISFRSSKQQT